MSHSMDTFKIGDLKFKLSRGGKSAAYFCTNSLVQVNSKVIDKLKHLLQESVDPQVRFNLHDDPADTLHEMIIIQRKDCDCRPHKHVNKDESYQIIEGTLEVRVYDDSGKITSTVELSRSREDSVFMFRVKRDQWHCAMPKTDFVIFKESRPGPFEGSDSIEPDWSNSEQSRRGG